MFKEEKHGTGRVAKVCARGRGAGSGGWGVLGGVREFREVMWRRGCCGCLVLRGNISKARRKSCQINFSPFQSHP